MFGGTPLAGEIGRGGGGGVAVQEGLAAEATQGRRVEVAGGGEEAGEQVWRGRVARAETNISLQSQR